MKKVLKKWQVLEEKDVSPSKWFPLYVHRVRLPNGKIIDDYFVSKLGDVAMVVAITKKKEIVFVKQYKHGVQDIILELPAGRIGKNKPEDSARKELREEVGIRAENMIPLGQIYVAPSKDSAKTYGFLVENAEITEKQKLDFTEDIEIVLVPIRKLDKMIKSGEIKAADTLALLSIARTKYPRLFS
jgi:8-oxo-dGTP pyrophosphatase MutT (NUDIX family)